MVVKAKNAEAGLVDFSVEGMISIILRIIA